MNNRIHFPIVQQFEGVYIVRRRRTELIIFALFFTIILMGWGNQSAQSAVNSGTRNDRKNDSPLTCNIKDYGAKGDGVTDDTYEIQCAANAALRNNQTLYIPPGNYIISNKIKLYTSVYCQGKILVPNYNIPTVVISRSILGKILSPFQLWGLTRGSTKIGGLSGYTGGTIVIRSRETLIRRDNATEPYYTKNDVMTILDSSGTISPGLDCSYYDNTQLTVTVYPYDKPINIDGLAIESFGNSGGEEGTCVVECNRSNVTFNDLNIKNTSNVIRLYYGLLLQECTNTTINNPVIINTGNYGISLNFCANTIINDGFITGCKHAITGRHSKKAVVSGGYYSKVIDCHWGNDYVIDGATIEGSGVMYAGTDITVKNCDFPSCSGGLLIVREDTPEIMGEVIFDNITVKGTNDWNLFGVGYGDWKTYIDYGRELATPDLISVTNIVADVPSTCRFNVIKLPFNLAQTNKVVPIGAIWTKGIKTATGLGKVVLGY